MQMPKILTTVHMAKYTNFPERYIFRDLNQFLHLPEHGTILASIQLS